MDLLTSHLRATDESTVEAELVELGVQAPLQGELDFDMETYQDTLDHAHLFMADAVQDHYQCPACHRLYSESEIEVTAVCDCGEHSDLFQQV